MAVYIVTGKLGNGKTLVTVGRIKETLERRCRVATNLDLNLVSMFHRNARGIEVVRIPDKPTIDDLNAIGRGYVGKYDEKKFGALVLDECGTWFNSRSWQDKSRKAVNDWFLHARKLGWDVYLIIQDINLLDSQARDALAEFTVYCRRLDNIRIPVIGGLVKALSGIRLTLPRVHRAKVCYASDDIVSDVWHYRGNHLFGAYKTDQLFLADYPHAPHCLLTPWHTHGRYSVPMNWRNIMRLTRIYWKRFKSPVAMATGALFGAVLAVIYIGKQKVDSLGQGASLPSFISSAEAAIIAEPELDSYSVRIKEVVQQLSIVGYRQINSQKVYELAVSKDYETTVFTSTDLAGMGVIIKPRGDCHFDAQIGNETLPVLCRLTM